MAEVEKSSFSRKTAQLRTYERVGDKDATLNLTSAVGWNSSLASDSVAAFMGDLFSLTADSIQSGGDQGYPLEVQVSERYYYTVSEE